RRQWVAWRYLRRDGRWTKVPLDPETGHPASTTDSTTWGDLGPANALVSAGRADGIGFVFAPDDPYCGLDLDDCRDPDTGALTADAQAIVDAFATYAEVSPSGTGVKLFFRATLPPGRRRSGNREVYDYARYFCVTGQTLPGSPDDVPDRQAV